MAWSGDFEDFSSYAPPTLAPQSKRTQGKWVQSHNYSSNNNQQFKTGVTAIRDLVLGVNNITIVGVVIAKEGSKAINSKKNPGTQRHLLSFLVRDTATDFINGTCWGSKDYIEELSSSFHIGDVIEVNHPQIQSKPQDGTDERFRPWTSSPFQMNISENHSTVKLYGGWNIDVYDKLKHIPVKASYDFYILEDVISNGQNLDKEHISLLVSVKHIGKTRDIVTKTGKHTQRCELKLFDETCNSFPLILWDREQIEQVQTWTPRDCVVFAADVRVAYDDFRKSMTATADCKTVFTLNPDTREAHSLYRYAQSVDFDDFSNEDNRATVDLDSITEVSTIEGVKRECQTRKENDSYSCIVFAFITHMNIDGDEESLYSVKCAKCKQRVDRKTRVCSNTNCPASYPDPTDTSDGLTIEQWNLSLCLSDCTGTMSRCLLCGEAASTMMGCTVAEFLGYSENQRTQLKWRFLLEKCKIYLKVALPLFDPSKPMARILSCSIADPLEATKYLR